MGRAKVDKDHQTPPPRQRMSLAQALLLTLFAGLTGITCLLLGGAVLWYSLQPAGQPSGLPITGSPITISGGGAADRPDPAILPEVPTRTPFQPVANTATATITLTPTQTSSPTASPTPLPSATASPTPSETPTQTASPTATQPPPSGIPDQASVQGVVGYPQSLPLTCESRSAVDWAAYFGVSIGEMEFQYALPTSDNPNRGFVGHPGGERGQIPPASYGVHAQPVATLLRSYGLSAQAHQGMSWDDIRREIATGDPVIAWVIGNVWLGLGTSYTAADGETMTVAPYEHTVIVVAYTPDTVTVVDGGMVYSTSLERFLASWSALDYMGIVQE